MYTDKITLKKLKLMMTHDIKSCGSYCLRDEDTATVLSGSSDSKVISTAV